MLATPSWIYLDLEKTGCTFMRSVLKDLFPRKVFVDDQKHSLQQQASPRPKLMTIREPAAYYFSLWSYGLDKKGGFFNQISRLCPDLAIKMYSSGTKECFAWFLGYVLHAPIRYPSASRREWLPMCCDLYTSRILSMLIPIGHRAEFVEALNADFSAQSFIRAVSSYVPDVLIRTSSLNADLYVLARSGRLDFLGLPEDWEVRLGRHGMPVNRSELSSALTVAQPNAWVEHASEHQMQLIQKKCAVAMYLFNHAADVIQQCRSELE